MPTLQLLAPLASLLLLLACSSQAAAPESGAGSPGGDADQALAELRAHQTEFMARPEHDADQVVVRHLLLCFAGAPGPPTTRSREEAEALTARLFAEARGGADFAALVAEYSDDSPDGVYTMVSGPRAPAGAYSRAGMVPAFGNAGWRLQPGEIGVVGHDPVASPYGWHIVQRLE